MRLFHELREIFRKPKRIAAVAFFYALIFIIAFAIGKSFSPIFSKNKESNPILAILIVAIYFIILLFVYCILKLLIIELVSKNKVSKKSFESLGGFFLANLAILAVSFAILALVGSFIAYSFNDAPLAGAIFLAVFMIFFYPFLLFFQFEFIERKRIFLSAKNALGSLFSAKLRGYLKILLFNIAVIGAYFLLFYLLGYPYKFLFIDSNKNPAAAIAFHEMIFTPILLIIILALASLNIFLIKKLKG